MATIKIKSGDQWTQIPMIGINPMPDAPSDGKHMEEKMVNGLKLPHQVALHKN